MRTVVVGDIKIGPDEPLALIAGPCVIESEQLVLRTAAEVQKIAKRVGMPFIFKSSYLKDNRSSATSYQGPGLDEGLRILQKVKSELGVPVLSDIHDQHEAGPAAEVLDVIQIPAYLSMQTSLTLAAARTGKPLNLKKGQFLDPADMKHVIGKVEWVGNYNILLTERGTFFGYHNLVVDFRSFSVLRGLGYPVVFDPTHAIRVYGVPSSDPAGGRPEFVPGLARAAVAAGCEAVFIETHPNCSEALCDAASMWPLDKLERLLIHLRRIDELRRELEYKQPIS
ncbi:MAG: 3-deoxy-8-phosphooctulonate synthase [candidate division KSB1 bacterium]|nr:3-deoxy-8-phosphooctulonate synthase [candidate division KSB1 bacterium]MDZ7295363.1 3-deoxy-8-phosphooctulonate synthase [candidate division KSB1 bacterium]MDZ7378119.1 3-deoxy-8-phosphooctulonate synthase [candidate division KSB1 bacterium]MDZ7385112.1 3-deoxy-8-phosphooctulonate synthase [candidate division KSB1 bacterium]MDZ7393118.1 3-deoxy-8-phosphooctulonate synthase [candidate division KSB1 bacterium]